MKRLACLLALGALWSCRSESGFDGGRSFPCHFGAEGEQCLNGWLCGVDDKCFDPSIVIARGCRRDAGPGGECVGGWLCGAKGVCFDPTIQEPRACVRDAGPEDGCAEGWLCGADRTCFDPSLKTPRACRRDAGPEDGCAPGWLCSADQTCFDPSVKAPRACKRDAGPDDGCAPGWLCGADRTCFDPSLQTPRPCLRDAGPEDGCGPGWLCGADRTCFDPTRENARPCLRDAGPEDGCAANWLCGADRVCFDQRRGAPRACLRDAGPEDACPGSWRCSVEGVCFDPSMGRAADCVFDDQCATAWRCNAASTRCQPIDAPAAYRCVVDTDCECSTGACTQADGGRVPPWRCDIGSRTCAPVDDAVSPRLVPQWQSQTLSPRDNSPLPSAVAVGTPNAVAITANIGLSNNSLNVVPIAMVLDGGVRALFFNRQGAERLSSGLTTPMMYVGSSSLTGVQEVAVSNGRVFARLADGSTFAQTFLTDATLMDLASGQLGSPAPRQLFAQPMKHLVQCDDSAFQSGPTGVKVLAVDDAGQGWAWSGFGDGGVSPLPQVPDGFSAAMACRDQRLVFMTQPPSMQLGLLSQQDGLQFLDPTSGTLPSNFKRPVRVLLHQALDQRSFQVAIEMEMADGGSGLFWARVAPQDAGTTSGSSDAGASTDGGAGPLRLQAAFLNGHRQLDALPYICPGGDAPQQFVGVSFGNNGAPQFAVRCEAARVGSTHVPAAEWLVRSNNNGFNAGPPVIQTLGGDTHAFAFGTVMAGPSRALQAHAGTGSHLWLDDDSTSTGVFGASQLRPLVLDRFPLIILEGTSMGGTARFALTSDYVYQYDATLGFVSQSDRLSGLTAIGNVRASVDGGALPWIVTSDGVYDARPTPLDELNNNGGSPHPLARLPSTSTLTAPAVARLGGQQLYVAGGDVLFTADVGQALVSTVAQPLTLQPVLSPSPGLRIRNFALARPTDAGTPIGFVTAAGAFLATPLTPGRWQLSNVDVSGLTGSALRVVSRSGKLRLAMSDGRLYTFPSRVALSEPLLDGGAVRDVVMACGDALALTDTGLWSLDAVDGGLATWKPSPLTQPLPSSEAATGQFVESASDVYIANDTGRIVQLQKPPAVCLDE